MKLRRARFKALRDCVSGSVLLEFAIIFPVLLTVFLGCNELTRMMRARRHMEVYATTVATDISATTTDVDAYTLREMAERIGLIAPELIDPTQSAWGLASNALSNNYLGVGISMALVTLNNPGCLTSCAYTAKLAWSFGNPRRACGAVTDIPLGSVQEGPVVIVDVIAGYKFAFVRGGSLGQAPTLTSKVFQAVKNWPSAATVPLVKSPQTAGTWTNIVTACPGF